MKNLFKVWYLDFIGRSEDNTLRKARQKLVECEEKNQRRLEAHCRAANWGYKKPESNKYE